MQYNTQMRHMAQFPLVGKIGRDNLEYIYRYKTYAEVFISSLDLSGNFCGGRSGRLMRGLHLRHLLGSDGRRQRRAAAAPVLAQNDLEKWNNYFKKYLTFYHFLQMG